MNVKKATLCAIIGISYIFISRAIGTFSSDVFTNLQVTRINTFLSLLAGLTIVAFYFSFYQSYKLSNGMPVAKSQTTLKNATIFVILGSLIMLLLFVKGLFLVFNVYNFPFPDQADLFKILLPWLSSIFTLFFYVAFYHETIQKVSQNLTKAVFLAIIGSSIGILLRTFILFNFVFAGKFMWMWNLSRKTPLIIIPLIVFMFGTTFYFFLTFYKEQNSSV